MKAIVCDRYGPPDDLALRDLDAPSPAAGSVLLRVRATAINPSDWHRFTGTPYIARPESGLRSPKRKIPGVDVAGVVEAIGDSATDFNVGDEVFGWTDGGGLAELVAAPQNQLVHKPDHISFESAAATGTAAFTALQALRDTGRLHADQHVLVNGASGGVGTFAIQIAHVLGATVTAVCSTDNIDRARALGANTVIDYTRDDFTETGDRFDLIVDIPGNRRLGDIRRILARGGRYVLIGGSKGRWLGPIPQVLRGLLLSVVTPQRFTALNAGHNRDDLIILRDLLDTGKVAPVTDRTYPLSETSAAFHYLASGHAEGKIIVVP